MKQLVTAAIVLARTNYGEADRIVTVLTPDYGKVRLIAKGVRKVRSKLAGGIELFSVSSITFIQGRSDIRTLISSRLNKHYGNIVGSIDRVQLGYELIKLLNKVIEDEAEPAYFTLLGNAFESLNDLAISADLIRTWFTAQLLRLDGHTPNLKTDTRGHILSANTAYDFDMAAVAFTPSVSGRFSPDDIKFMRLIFSNNQPKVLAQIRGQASLLLDVAPVVRAMRDAFIGI